MWRFVDRLLQIVLLTAAAAALFVVGGVMISAVRGTQIPADEDLLPGEPLVEVRVSSHGDISHLFVGQPVVLDVELLNLEARRVRNQTHGDPAAAAAAAEILLDAQETPWEHRLEMRIATGDETAVLEELDWRSRLLGPMPAASERRLWLAPARTTFVLDGSDLASLDPGPYEILAALPAGTIAPERVRVVPLRLALHPAPISDLDRAVVSLAVSRVAALKGEPGEAIEAALTALALDPLQDEALAIIAESWEEQGDIDRAAEWYERYLETLPAGENDRRAELEAYVRALRQQR